jgi:alpha-D-ribose 1-methylphosphonate 5-triphosphate synthase subunit PhnI
MYVAVQGGQRAIENANALLASERRGDPAVAELDVRQIAEQLTLAVDRVMAEGSLYDRELAALAIKQARGDLIEAIFLLRAYRTTLPRYQQSQPLDTAKMTMRRRISATFKDLPGGQVLGPTFDYTHRLLDFSLLDNASAPPAAPTAPDDAASPAMPRVTDLLGQEGLIDSEIASDDGQGVDITRQPLLFPAVRPTRLQVLARGDEGFLLGLAYSSQRGYGSTHPFAAEIRVGDVGVTVTPAELGFAIEIGEITVTECQMVNQFKGSAEAPARFTRGYGLVFGHQDRKAMSMAIVDRTLRAGEIDEERTAPAQDEEFVLYHCDNVEASGFLQHLKLPHYVDFQAELELVRRLRAEASQAKAFSEAAE